MELMMRKASRSAASLLICRGFATKSHILAREKRRFPHVPTVDFSSIREANDVIRLFRETVAMCPQPSFLVYNKLLSLLAKMKKHTVALSMFDEMRQWSVPVNEYTMNIIIGCCCHLNRIDFGFSVLGYFLKRDCNPNATTFNTLLKGLFLVGNVKKAETFFQKVLTLKLCEPDDIMFLTVIDGLCKAGKSLTSLDFLERTTYKPNVYSYNAVIDGLCKDGLVDDALHLLSEMPDKGVQPDVVTYNSIIHGLCSCSRWNEVKYLLLVEMLHDKVPLNVVTFTTLMDVHCKDGKIREAESILELMVKMNVFPNIITYNAMIEGYCRSGNVDEAWCLFQDIPRIGLKHTIVSYNTMIHGFFGSSRFVDGWKLFKDLEAQHMRPNLCTYNILLDGLCLNRQFDEAFSFMRMMEDKGVNPNMVTFGTLIHGLCKVGKLNIARNLVNQLPSKGLRPNVQIYTTLIGSLFKEGLDEEAKGLLFEMEKNGSAPNAVTYNIIVESLLKRNKVYDAIPFMEEMYKRGFLAHSTNVSMLLNVIRGEGKDGNLLDVIKRVLL
ncbi:hypothetical protein ACS0TY_030954 [Phlomoides rotata]